MNPLMSLYQAMQHPQLFVENAMKNNKITSNPMARNAMELMQKGDGAGLEKMARNMCQERGISPDEAVKQLKQQLGIK